MTAAQTLTSFKICVMDSFCHIFSSLNLLSCLAARDRSWRELQGLGASAALLASQGNVREGEGAALSKGRRAIVKD